MSTADELARDLHHLGVAAGQEDAVARELVRMGWTKRAAGDILLGGIVQEPQLVVDAIRLGQVCTPPIPRIVGQTRI